MTKADFENMEPGTLLIVGDRFNEGMDCEDVKTLEYLLNGYITFQRLDGAWVYHYEVPDCPFHISELIGPVCVACLDEERESYEVGDFRLLFGEVS